jgi:hypothetical protein
MTTTMMAVHTGRDLVQGWHHYANGRMNTTAIAVIEEWNSWSKLLNVEFGGHVCQSTSGAYVATVPNTSDVADQVTPSECARAVAPVARSHTHGAYGLRGPSEDDILNANSLSKLVFYVGTPCNSIVVWQGPDSVKKQETLRGCQ